MRRSTPVRGVKDTSARAHAIRRARSEERLRNAHVLNAVRAAAVAVVGLAFFVAPRAGFPSWDGGDLVCAVWTALAVAVWLGGLRWRAVAKWSGYAFPLLDVPAVFAIQLAVIPAMPDAPRLIALGTAPLALLIVGSTFWLEYRLVWLTTLLATASQAALLFTHDGGVGAVLVTVLMLCGMAAATSFGVGRIHALNETTTKHMTDLQLVEDAFRDLLNHSPDGIVVHRNGSVLYANAQLGTILRESNLQALRTRRVTDVVHPDDRGQFQQRIDAVADGSVASPPAEIRLTGSDGGVIPAEVRDVGVQFADAPAVLTVVRDLTGIKQMQERLIVSDRMASMGTLAAGVAHEINNPLTAVVGHLDLLAAELDGGETPPDDMRIRHAVAEALPDMRDAATRVRDIVRDLNMFSRAGDQSPKLFDVHKVLDSSLRIAANEFRHRARLVREYGDVPLVLGNDARLGQVFLNLAVNAAQAIPEGNAGRNTVTVATFSDDSGRVVVEVRDTGAGMSEELRQRIFEPFFTTKPAGFGTGLGLTICQRIVAEAGGEIAVESEPGCGTTFRVTLPTGDPGEAPAAVRSAPNHEVQRSANVLVLDDEPMIVKMVERLLAPPHRVTGMTVAADALARLKAGERYDVILCDLMMPHMTGMDVFAEVKLMSPEQASRMIFLTGGAFTERARAFLDSVPNLRLDKPFERNTLRTLVAHALR